MFISRTHPREHVPPPSLLRPPGLVYPTETKFVRRLRELEKSQQNDSIPLIPSTVQELEDMLSLCCYKPLHFPKLVQSWKQFFTLQECLCNVNRAC